MKYIHYLLLNVKSLIERFSGSGNTRSVFKNVGILASGSIISKIIGFASYPVITRLYTPDDFGILAVFTSALFIIYPFGTLRYSITIPLPKSNGLAMNIFALGLVLLLVITIFLSALFLLVGNKIFSIFNATEISTYWWLLVLGIAGASLFDLLTHWATRIKSFTTVAKAHIWQTLAAVFFQIALGLIGIKPGGLLSSEVARKGIGVFTLSKKFQQELKQHLAQISSKRILFVFKYYRYLPIYHLPSQLLSILTLKIPLLFYAFNYGTETAGQLGLALMVVGVPMGLLGRTTANAYYAEIANIGSAHKQKIFDITKSLAKRLLLIGSFPTLLLLLFSPFMFQFLFGSAWLQAGQFTSIMAFYLFFEFMVTPFIKIFNVFNAQRKYLEISIVRIVLIVVVFISVFVWGIDAYLALALYTFAMIIHHLYTIGKIYNILR